MGIQTFASRSSSCLEVFWTKAVKKVSLEGSYDESMLLDDTQLELGAVCWFMLFDAVFGLKLDELDNGIV